MEAINALRNRLPDAARDMKLNLQSVLEGGSLNADQRWGTAVASAFATRNRDLVQAVLTDAAKVVGDAVLEDARAAASVMGMNNVYYRFRHMVEKEGYTAKPPRLRMNVIAKPKTNKGDFELFCLAVSAINGCSTCVRSHEASVLSHGLTDDHVHDAVRIASVMQGAAVSLELA